MANFAFPGRGLVDQSQSALVERPDIPRSRFRNQWSHKTTMDANYLVPVMVDHLLPGDHVQYKLTNYIRMQTPQAPIFDNQKVVSFAFFVPYRLLWVNWEKFCGAQTNPGDSTAFTVPTIPAVICDQGPGSLWNYFGLVDRGLLSGSDAAVNAFPFRAYAAVWNQWFRDENLQDSWTLDTGDTSTIGVPIFKRNKQHDYITSCLPFPQKGTAPTVPIGTSAPVVGIAADGGASGAATGLTDTRGVSGLTYTANYPVGPGYPGSPNVFFRTDIPVYADLSAATGVNINQFRQAMLVQQLLEKDARGGTRYVEILRMHFGINPQDYRLQRPELIGTGSSPLNVSPVAQTAPTTGQSVGFLGAAAVGAGQHTASYAAQEHGVVIWLLNIQSELSYQTGLDREWSRRTRYDYYWPSLAGLGEQAVLSKEVYWRNVAADNDVFGYQERYQEYRTRTSMVTGYFNSFQSGTLDYWHLAEKFLSRPVLGSTFIKMNAPVDRVLAAGGLAFAEQYLCDFLIERQKTSPMPIHGTPVQLGRF